MNPTSNTHSPTTHKPITHGKKDKVSCQKTFEFGAENKTVREFVTPKSPKNY